MKLKVAIVEDDRGVREAWEELLARTVGFECVGAYGTAEEAIAKLPDVSVDAVLMDLNLPNRSGVECTRLLREQLPAVQILVLTVCEDVDTIFQALKAGANGYLLKRVAPQRVFEALREIVSGGAPMSSEIARKVIESMRQAGARRMSAGEFSRRETEVLELLAQGYANKEIAARLNISFDTVRTHLKNIYEKLHVHSRAEAIARYFARDGGTVRTLAH